MAITDQGPTQFILSMLHERGSMSYEAIYHFMLEAGFKGPSTAIVSRLAERGIVRKFKVGRKMHYEIKKVIE